MPIINGGGGGGGTFNGGTITAPLSIDLTNHPDATPLFIRGATGGSADLVQVVDGNDTNVLELIQLSGHGAGAYLASQVTTQPALSLDGASGTAADVLSVAQSGPITAGITKNNALKTSPPVPSTVALVSGTGAQLSTAYDVESVTPFTGDATNNAATCKVEVSADDITYYTLNTVSVAAALNFTGALDQSVNVRIPRAWYLKLTAVHGTIGTTTYY